MTIDSAYFLEVYKEDGGLVYPFSFEIISDATNLIVSKITTAGAKVALLSTDYKVVFNSYIAPISEGGVVTLVTKLATGEKLAIQRSTPITNDQVFADKQPFNTDAYEFQVDKLTLILQEIEGHICDCRKLNGGGSAISHFCRYYFCNAYQQGLQASSAHSVWLLNNNAVAPNPFPKAKNLDPSWIGTDSATPGTAGTQGPALLSSPCAGEGYSLSVDGMAFDSGTITYTFTASFLHKYDGVTTVLMYYGYQNSGTLIILSNHTLSTTLTLQFSKGGLEEINMPGFFATSTETCVISLSYDQATRVWKIYKNWVLYQTGVSTTVCTNVSGVKNNKVNPYSSHFALWSAPVSDAEVAALRTAWLQNDPTYVDPDSWCTPTVFDCDAYYTALMASTCWGFWPLNTFASYATNAVIPAAKNTLSAPAICATSGIAVNGAPYFPSTCSPEKSCSGGGTSYINGVFSPTFVFTWTCAVTSGQFFDCVYRINDSAPQIIVRSEGTGNVDMRLSFEQGTIEAYVISNFRAAGETCVISFSFDRVSKEWKLYKNWVLHSTGFTTRTYTSGITLRSIETGLVLGGSYHAIWESVVSDSEVATLRAALLANYRQSQTPWTPENIVCTLWLDASDATTLNLTGSDINSWDDKSDGFNDTVLNGVTKPILTVAGLSGKNIVTFNDGNTLKTPTTWPLSGDPAFSIFIVAKKTTVAKGSLIGWGDVSTNVRSIGMFDSGVAQWWGGSGTAKSDMSAVPNGSWVIHGVVKGAGAYNTNMNMYQNGYDAANGAGSVNTPALFTGNACLIGQDANSTTNRLVGSIAEVIVIPRKLALAERQKVEGYLAHKWGLTGNLDVTHPYKTSPP